MANCIEKDHIIFLNDPKKARASKKKFYQRWWHQDYRHQRFSGKVFEHNLFYKTTITLLLFDCVLVIIQTVIDFTKVKSECVQKSNWLVSQYKEQIETLMTILHYSSISILTLFVLEFGAKIYIFGRDFWNIHKRKWEYFDGFIVIFSFGIDIYFLQNQNNYFMEHRFTMITGVRLWRMIRIINSVAQCAISNERKKKESLDAQYFIVIEQFLDLLKYKTNHPEKVHENTEEHFTQIDSQCQDLIDVFREANEQIASPNALKQFSEQLQALKSSICN